MHTSTMAEILSHNHAWTKPPNPAGYLDLFAKNIMRTLKQCFSVVLIENLYIIVKIHCDMYSFYPLLQGKESFRKIPGSKCWFKLTWKMFSWAKPHLPAKQTDSQTYLNRLTTFLAEVVIKKIRQRQRETWCVGSFAKVHSKPVQQSWHLNRFNFK